VSPLRGRAIACDATPVSRDTSVPLRARSTRETRMMTDTCGRCGRAIRPDDTITVSGVDQRCYRCFNEEMSARVGVAFDHTPFDPIVLADHDGVPRTSEIRSMLVATGHAMRAEEVPRRERGGYRFAVLGDFEADAWELFQRLYQKMRRELAVRHIEQTEHGWQLIDGDRLTGRIEWDDDADGVAPLLVVDGKALTWQEVGRILMSREGFTLHAEVTDSIEVVGGPLAKPGEGDD
jgi:hypothetical protein